MTDVKHMKWWGWGLEGVGFHWEDKPAFAPFVLKAVGLDLHTAQPVKPPEFSDISVPKSKATAAFQKSLAGVVGAEHVTTDDMARAVHVYGKSLRDLVRMRGNAVKRYPDVVVYPGSEAEVQEIVDAAVAADAVIIPFGGGSNIAGSLEPLPTEKRVIISLDLGRLDQVLEIDEYSGVARIQAGAQGPDLEKQLNDRGWTIGHFPDSFTHSTIGGWVATRSSGMQSDKYGDISDIAVGMRVVRPGGTIALRPTPSASNGPSVREMILGSEGRLGVITEVSANVRRIPEERVIQAYFFPDWSTGLKALHEISESDAAPSITRISDGRETGFSLATSKESKGLSKFITGTLLPWLMRRKGWTDLEKICLSFIGFEGSPATVKRNKKLVDAIVKKYNGMGVGTSPGVLYDQKKFDTPYLRDFLLDRGAAGDVSETAMPWERVEPLYDATIAAAEKAYADMGIKGWIMAHLSHSYSSGACLYFTFAFVFQDPAKQLEEYDTVKRAIQQAFVDNGGTISHHHGVGLEHSPWIEQDISPEGVAVMSALFTSTDPGRNLNPNKVIASV
ncbi:MAG: FAD-binding oxidoreductase [Actinomycetales bacterium]|nr:FAD-binding oxidoreductase [Actinomycetales bacterium]